MLVWKAGIRSRSRAALRSSLASSLHNFLGPLACSLRHTKDGSEAVEGAAAAEITLSLPGSTGPG